ncbi:hypothetical protein ACGFIJ_37205 [Microbispora bryophytorum]|uniref:hypothetical protein n=1 Tax=Microbispora bryophytorum TaxID=1460882 RepID=UPI00370F7956
MTTNPANPPVRNTSDRLVRRRPTAKRPTILLAQRAGTRTIMEILGHSIIVLTMNTYAHVLPEHQATALDKLEKALGGLA